MPPVSSRMTTTMSKMVNMVWWLLGWVDLRPVGVPGSPESYRGANESGSARSQSTAHAAGGSSSSSPGVSHSNSSA